MSHNFNIDTFTSEKKRKYQTLIQKADISRHNHESISIVGPATGLYKKIENYYIHSSDRTYHIAKPHQIENNKLKSCVCILTNMNDHSIIQMIKYYIPNRDGRDTFKAHNINGLISGFTFDDNGNLEYVYTSQNGQTLITTKEAINEIKNAQQEIENKIRNKQISIDSKQDEIRILLQEITALKQEKLQLGTAHPSYSKLTLVSNLNKVVIKSTFEICDACSEHVKQFYAAREFTSNIL